MNINCSLENSFAQSEMRINSVLELKQSCSTKLNILIIIVKIRLGRDELRNQFFNVKRGPFQA